MHRFFDHAGSGGSSRKRCHRCCLPLRGTTSAPRTRVISRLNSPACVYPCQRFANALTNISGRGRNRPFGRPPAQIPACGTTALGSSLGSNVGSHQARTDAHGPARSTRRFRLCVRDALCWPRSPRGVTSRSRPPERARWSGSVSGARCADRVPLALPPSLHHLRSRTGLVRRLRRYYEAVRLPTTVHLGRAALAFPKRPAPFPVGGQSWDLPVLAHEDSAHAQVLRPRGVP